MIDQHPSSSVAEPASRRRLLRLMGAGGAALVATLLPPTGVRAGHDGTNVLHLGEVNNTPLDGGFAGRTDVGTDTNDFGFSLSNAGTGEAAGGLYVTARGGKPVIEADIVGEVSADSVAVQGVSGAGETFGQGPGTGVQGISGSGIGVEGHSESGAGVAGRSEHGVGGNFETADGQALSVQGPAAFEVDVDNTGPFFFRNHNTGEGAHVIYAQASGLKPAIHGESDADGGSGVSGVSTGPGFVDQEGTGDGVSGKSGTGFGVVGRSTSGAGVSGQSDTGKGVVGISNGSSPGAVGVVGYSAEGIGLSAESPNLALEVLGKSRFSTAGSSVIPAGGNSAAVANSAVTANSHIMVTLIRDPGPRQLAWVERQPGTGFVVHLTSAPPPQRPATDFTYFIVDMP